MNKPDTGPWDRNRGIIRSSKGGWYAGKGVYSHGYDMMRDLVGQVSYMQVIILNATGRLPSREVADWYEAAFICMSWPDSRIWCNLVGALAGDAGCSPVSATVAGTLVADSHAFGIGALPLGVSFIQQALRKQQDGLTAEEIIEAECKIKGKTPGIMGYARPLAKGDERVDSLEQITRTLGFSMGPHMLLAYEIEKIMTNEFAESMNINGYASAFLSDQGYTSEDLYRICACLVSSGVTACFVDSSAKTHGTFLPLWCEDIDYQGKELRSVPDK